MFEAHFQLSPVCVVISIPTTELHKPEVGLGWAVTICSYYWVYLKTDKHTASSFTDRGEDDNNRHHHKESFFNVKMIHYQPIWCVGRVAW